MSREEDLLRVIRERSEELELAQGRRDEAIRAAVKAGIIGEVVGEAAGISRQRVSQIMRGTR